MDIILSRIIFFYDFPSIYIEILLRGNEGGEEGLQEVGNVFGNNVYATSMCQTNVYKPFYQR